MPRALVISGGGSKGAFAVGVLKQLAISYPRLDFDIYVGTSAGALVNTLASIKELALLEQLYTTTKTSDILRSFNVVDRINQHSLYDANGAWNKIVTYYPDQRYAQLQRTGKKVFITTTCLQTHELTVFTNDAAAIKPEGYTVTQLINADHYRRALMASICEPVFMPPVKVNLHVPLIKNPNFQYVDGGVTKYAGVQMAIDAGATEIFVIILAASEPEVRNTEFTTLLPILQQTVDILTTDVAENDLLIPERYIEALRYIGAVKQKMIAAGIPAAQVEAYFRVAGFERFQDKMPARIFRIQPAKPLGGGPGGLVFDPAEMKQMVAKGQAAVTDFITTLNPRDVTWA